MKSGVKISKSQMVAMHNAVTNELETAKVTMIVQRDIPRYNQSFTVLFQAVNIAVAKKIKPVTAKMLLFLCSVVDYNNTLDFSVTELAAELDYTNRNILLALKELEEFKIIIRIPNPKDKRRNLIMINPMQSWKGTVKERKAAIQSLTAIDENQLQIPFDELLPPKKLESTSRDEAIQAFELQEK